MTDRLKCVLFSMQPMWVEKVFRGEKDDEIRKIAPDIKAPFKAFVYCTKDGYDGRFPRKEILSVGDRVCNGMVVGEFICTGITEVIGSEKQIISANRSSRSCVSDEDLRKYVSGKNRLSFIHIGDRIAYSTPINLARFEYWKPRVLQDSIDDEYFNLQHQIERAPQSWCYVKEPPASVVNRERGIIQWVQPAVQCGECVYRCKGPADGMCFMKSSCMDKKSWCLLGEKRCT